MRLCIKVLIRHLLASAAVNIGATFVATNHASRNSLFTPRNQTSPYRGQRQCGHLIPLPVLQIIRGPAAAERANEVHIRIQLLRSKLDHAALRFKRCGLRLDHVQITGRAAPVA